MTAHTIAWNNCSHSSRHWWSWWWLWTFFLLYQRIFKLSKTIWRLQTSSIVEWSIDQSFKVTAVIKVQETARKAAIIDNLSWYKLIFLMFIQKHLFTSHIVSLFSSPLWDSILLKSRFTMPTFNVFLKYLDSNI